MGAKTRVQITTHGKDADELLKELDRLFLDVYGATPIADGQYLIDKRMNLFALDTLSHELIEIVKRFGPDTYYSTIYITSAGFDFRCIDMGT